MNEGLKIPFEVADQITLENLKNQMVCLKEQNRRHIVDGVWMHPEDLGNNIRYIAAMELLIPYFGGSND